MFINRQTKVSYKLLLKNDIYNLIFSFLSVFAMYINIGNIDLNDNRLISRFYHIIDTGDIKSLFIFAAVYYFGKNQKVIRNKIRIISLSMLFSGCLILGDWCQNFDIIFFDLALLIANLISFIGYFYLSYLILNYIYYWMVHKLSDNEIKNSISKNHIVNKYFTVFGISLMILSWLPFILFYWPGIAFNDGMRSLTYYYGKVPWHNHHPYLVTVIMGICMDIGKGLGSEKIGIFVYTIFQIIITLITLGRILNYMKKLNSSFWVRIITVLYFAFFPYWKVMFYSLQKDPIYTIVGTNMMLALVDIFVISNSPVKNIKYIEFLLWGGVLCLLRNNGVYVVVSLIPVCFIVLLMKKNFRDKCKKIVVYCFFIILFYGMFIKIGLSLLNVDNSHATQETFSVLYQQTARFKKYYNDDIDEKERDVLFLTFNHYENFGELYNPVVANPIKDNYISGNLESFIKYLRVWFSQFRKHPGCYVSAFLYHTYKYYCPNVMGKGGIYEYTDSDSINPNHYLDVEVLDKFENQREIIKMIASMFKKVPVLGLLYNCGMYFWIMIMALLFFIKKGYWEDMIIFAPLLGTEFTAILSPINGDLRYIMLVMYSLPILIMLINKRRNCSDCEIEI